MIPFGSGRLAGLPVFGTGAPDLSDLTEMVRSALKDWGNIGKVKRARLVADNAPETLANRLWVTMKEVSA